MKNQPDDTTIERASKNRDNPYGMLRRATFDGSQLTFEERGVLAYILMKPDNWKANIKDLMREGGIGRNKTYDIINGLIAKGYAERTENRDSKGHFQGSLIKFHEEPLPVNPLPEKRDTDKRDTVNPLPVNRDHNNKGETPITESTPIIENNKDLSPPPLSTTNAIKDAYVKAVGHKLPPSSFRTISPDAKFAAEQGVLPSDIRETYDILASEPFWRGKTIPLRVVLDKIANNMTIRNGKGVENGQAGENTGYNQEEIAAIRTARRTGDKAEVERILRAANARIDAETNMRGVR